MNMKIHRIFKCGVFIVTLLSLLVSCSDNNESVLLGSDDQLSFSSSGADSKFTVCASGAWEITTDADWLTFSKSKGEGDGQTREQIIVTAARNTSTARQATFLLTAAGKTLTVTCQQEEGHPFKLGTASLSASLEIGKSATGVMINIPYEYGYKDMNLTVHTVLSGAGAAGLQVDDQNITLDTATGMLSLPITGRPTSAGNLVITVSTNQGDSAPAVLNAVVNARIILEEHFNLCIYGGDFVADQPGTAPAWVKDGEGKNVAPDPLGTLQSRTPKQDGSNDLFATMAHSYLVSKGLADWQGAKVYERPGYLKLGTASAAGKITTPAFTALGTDQCDLLVTLKVSEWVEEEGGQLAISLEGSGTLSTNKYVYKHARATAGSEWEEVQFVITGAAADTRIVFTTKSNKRFAIDDLVVSVK